MLCFVVIAARKLRTVLLFVKNCGAKITNNDKTERVQLKCKECGGVMTADSSNKTLHCPYCGSSEVIVYGDAVEVERIRNDTYKEMEYKKWEREDEKERKAEKKKADEAYKKKWLRCCCNNRCDNMRNNCNGRIFTTQIFFKYF